MLCFITLIDKKGYFRATMIELEQLDSRLCWHPILPIRQNGVLMSLLWGSVNHQMAVPVPSISYCVLNHHNLFYRIQNALAFNRDTCCHLALCLQLLPSHSYHWDQLDEQAINISAMGEQISMYYKQELIEGSSEKVDRTFWKCNFKDCL